MGNEKTPKTPITYCCLSCAFNTHHKRDYNKHLLTAKHQMITNGNIKREIHFICECGREYKNRHGLSRHRKTCAPFSGNEPIPSNLTTTLIMEIIKENKEIKNLLFEQQKENNILMNKMLENTLSISAANTTNNTTNNNTTNNNTNNTQFNIQLFLNETCKNAINFTDFIDNIQVTDNDLENNAKMGFVEGVTKIIMDNLRQLELTNRPIHCTDVKRETIYVKDEDQWEKDNSKEVIQKGIQEITCKNMCQLSEWRENNPEYDDLETELGEKSIVMQQSSMAGGNRDKFYPKIIKNIAKETIIEK